MNEIIQNSEHELDSATSVVEQLLSQANRYIEHSKAFNTVKSYESDWRHFTEWCQSHGFDPLPASDKAYGLYIANLAITGYKVSTITRRMSSIAEAHRAANQNSPTSEKVKAIMAGIRRLNGSVEKVKKPVMVEMLKVMISFIPDTNKGLRDKTILLVGFTGAFRRSELVDIDRENIEFNSKGMVVTLKRSKTDQEGKGEQVGIPYGMSHLTCPVLAMQAWIDRSLSESGPIFKPINRHGQVLKKRLSSQTVALIVKEYASKAGYDADDFSGHSLRSGLATTAAISGKSERSIMSQTRHRSEMMVRKYIRQGSLFQENAASDIGL